MPCEAVDAAARKVITDAGFGPGYKVPGLPHRTGHGIGLDVHEWTNFVRGNKTPLQPGMCFSDEPMIAIYGEFGIRLEDCLYITESGAKFFTPAEPGDRSAVRVIAEGTVSVRLQADRHGPALKPDLTRPVRRPQKLNANPRRMMRGATNADGCR